jgi:hypothetical protein
LYLGATVSAVGLLVFVAFLFRIDRAVWRRFGGAEATVARLWRNLVKLATREV